MRLLSKEPADGAPPQGGGLEFRQVGPESPEWESLLARTEHSIFHEPIWARVLADGLNGKPFCVILCREGSAVAGMVGVELRFLWVRQLYFCVPYGGIIGQATEVDQLGTFLRGLARKRRAARVRIVDWPGHVTPAIPGANVLEDQTQVLHFNGLTYEVLWSRFRKNIRRDVRIAQRGNVRVVEADDESDVSTFYELYLASMERNRAIPKYGREFVAAFFRHLVPEGRGAIFLAKIGERPIAGIMLVNSGSMSHYLMGGSRPETLGLCPNDLLIDHAIRYSMQRGLDALDFLPSGPGAGALQRFKRKWGACSLPINTSTIDTRPFSTALWDLALKVSRARSLRHQLVRYRRRA